MRLAPRTLAGIVCYAGIANFFLFLIIDLAIGGDALNGKIEAGRYFLSQNGRYTEVSRWVWTYSRIHATTAMAGWALAIIVGIASEISRKRTA